MALPVLEGKVTIVTGAALGVGKATAERFAEAKAKIVVADCNVDKGQETVAEIIAAGGAAIFIKTDVSKSEDVQTMVQFAVKTYGRLDIAVNNAVLPPDDKLADAFDEEYWDRLMAVNLKGAALCQKYELQQMKKQGNGGSIINISSINGYRQQLNNITYVAAEHGVAGITKMAALENGQYNIRVNSVASGALKPFGHTPLNHFGQFREIAEATLWLASDASSYVTGTTIHADAGYTSL